MANSAMAISANSTAVPSAFADAYAGRSDTSTPSPNHRGLVTDHVDAPQAASHRVLIVHIAGGQFQP